MTKLMSWWKAESATIVGIVLALINASVINGTAGKILGAVLPLLGAGAVRHTVFAPATVANLVGTATTAVASQLDATAAGTAGTLTAAGQAVADGIAAAVAPQGD